MIFPFLLLYVSDDEEKSQTRFLKYVAVLIQNPLFLSYSLFI